MALAPHRSRSRRSEPLIALINVVFLMLIFFLVSASIAPPLPTGVDLVDTRTLDRRSPPDAAVIGPDGDLSYRGAPITPAAYLALHGADASEAAALRVIPDRALPAARLIAIAAELQAAGAGAIWIVTEQALP